MRHPIAVASLAALLGCTDRSPSPDLDEEPLVNGTIATGATHPYAVFLTSSTPGGLSLNCTGTLIEPDIVLTAAHCVVCADSVVAWVLGESAPGQTPGTQPALPHFASSFRHCRAR